ncbi:hypothetical protein LCGC14_1721000 [marine sediment metagenome]|uniref:Uncharacterized protein n=1 Tax=marine sediment metagenome TaxID=412755 RepID=A0A0F9HC70_9ZZZZ
MVLIIILSVVIAVACFVAGVLVGASGMQSLHRESLTRIKTMVDNIADSVEKEKTVLKQINKLRRK